MTWLFREASATAQEVGDSDEVLARLLKLREDAHRKYLGIPIVSEENAEDENPRTPGDSSLAAQGIAAERSMLGCMLQSEDAIADVVELVASSESVFARDLHFDIYVALLELYGRRVDVTADAVARIVEGSVATPLNVRSYLDDLSLDATDPREAAIHAERVVELAMLRRVESMGMQFAEWAQRASGESDLDAGAVVTTVENEVFSFINEMTKVRTVSSTLDDAIDELDATGAAGEAASSVSSGFVGFDALTSGFRPGELTVVAGASGLGKSTLGLDFVRACSISQGRTSYLVTLQMNRKEMATRMMAAEARVPLDRMRSRTLKEDDWTRLARVMPSVNSAPVWMQDEATYTLPDLVQSCRRLHFFNDLQLIVIDSLDLLYVDRRSISAGPDTDLPVLGRELRNLAKELNVPIVALLQIDQPSLTFDGYQPTLRDVPGGLERFADVVVLLYRDDAYERDSPRAGEADLIVAKNRSGPTAKVAVAFQGHYARFVDMGR
ncbi:replicative DNA helicase [Streptomyces olivaceus]